MQILKSAYFILLFCIINASAIYAQIGSFDIGVGLKVRYFYGIAKGSSNYSASLAIGITRSLEFGKEEKHFFQPSYQLAVNMYANGLGNNILKEYRVTEIDVVNSISATLGHRPEPDEYLFEHRIFNGMTASPFIQDTGPFSATLGTSFIANNHKRNQSVGYAGFNAYYFRVGYYNDATPFKRTADLNDRWWTGGVLLQFGPDVYNPGEDSDAIFDWKLQISYERFTGDVQDAYRFASRIGMPLVPAKKECELFLNRALTSVTFAHDSGFGASLSFLGHSRFFDLQDYIHNAQGSAKHHSFAKSYWFVGMKFNSVTPLGTVD